jgi:hypothetical protein
MKRPTSFDNEFRQAHSFRPDDTARHDIETQAVRGALKDMSVEPAVRERSAVVRT